MKKVFCAILLTCILLSCLSLYSCSSGEQKYSDYTFDYFDTYTEVSGYAKSNEDFKKVFSEVLAQLEEYHKLFTIYDRYEGINNLLTVNELHNGEHKAVKVDKKIIDMLLFSKEMYEKTDGNVNVAMGSVLSIWHTYREAGIKDKSKAALPNTEELQEAASHTDINDLIIDKEASTVFLSDPKMKLDVGAIAKGYAAEQIAKYLISQGITGYVLNIGGNVRAIGAHADGEPWLTGIENPSGDENAPYYNILELKGLSLVTSGSYQRFYTVNDKDYHHIISKDTLFPAEGYTSVSIVCESSAIADALSTALFCMSLNDGQALIDNLDQTEAMWVKSNGDIIYSKGFSKHIKET